MLCLSPRSPGPHQPPTQVGAAAAHRRPVLHPRRRPPRVPPMEPQSRVDLDGTSGVQFVGYTLAVLSILAPPRWRLPCGSRRPDHRHLLDHRPAVEARAGRRSARIATTSTTGCWTWACSHRQTVFVIYGLCLCPGGPGARALGRRPAIRLRRRLLRVLTRPLYPDPGLAPPTGRRSSRRTRTKTASVTTGRRARPSALLGDHPIQC